MSRRESRTWVLRGVLGLVLAAVLYGAATAANLEPQLMPLTLAVLATALLVGVLFDLTSEQGTDWQVEAVGRSIAIGEDARAATWVRVLEGNQTARQPSDDLCRWLAGLTDDRLRRHRGLTRDDPAAATLLGPVLSDVLSGSVRRLTPDQINECVERIERL